MKAKRTIISMPTFSDAWKLRNSSVALSRRYATTAGMRSTMPAMMMSEMPLPMPNSSTSSPSHIRKTVPQVMATTATMK